MKDQRQRTTETPTSLFTTIMSLECMKVTNNLLPPWGVMKQGKAGSVEGVSGGAVVIIRSKGVALNTHTSLTAECFCHNGAVK